MLLFDDKKEHEFFLQNRREKAMSLGCLGEKMNNNA